MRSLSRLLSGGRRTEAPSRSVLILGMHRSGTSCLAGMLEHCGLHLGEVNRSSRHNPRGNHESRVAMAINDDLLALAGGSWREPRDVGEVAPELAARIERYRRTMRATGQVWGIKDPRMLFCLGAWAEPTTALVGTFRHPVAVARSLEARLQARKRPESVRVDWQALWFEYNARLVALYRRAPFPVVDFDWEAERYLRVVGRVARWAALPGRGENFFDESLRHHRGAPAIDEPRHRDLYAELGEIAATEERKLAESFPASP